MIDEIKHIQDLYFELSNSIESWDIFIIKLTEFKKIHGHCDVPASHEDKWFAHKINTTRQYYKKKILKKERVDLLNDMGFSWEFIDDSWDRFIAALTKFRNKHGHCNVSMPYEDEWLGRKVSKTRKDYKNGNLSTDRIGQLNEMGFVWDVKEKSWTDFIAKLTEFKKVNGHCNVPEGYEDKWLAQKVANERDNYVKKKISQKRITQLNKLEFCWKVREDSWNIFISKLKDFKRTHGHCNVPKSFKDKQLVYKVRNTRIRYKEKKLGKEIIARLNNLGFNWKIKTDDDPWGTFIAKLEKFKEKNGHCNVPTYYNDKWLANKVIHVRQLHKAEKLDQKKIEQLLAMDFSFSIVNITWDDFMVRLNEFKEKQGHCNVPYTYKDKLLSAKVMRVRQNYIIGRLENKKIRQLEKIGFELKATTQ